MTMIRSSLRSGASLTLILLVALLLPACTGGDGSSGGGTVAVTDGVVELTSDELEFDASTIQAPAGEAFTIAYTNLESQPHNVAVYVQEGGEEIVVGEVITGPDATDEVEVPALDPGTYYFRCDVHPEMEGTIVVEG